MGDNSETLFYSVVPKTPEQRSLSIPPTQQFCDTKLMDSSITCRPNGAVRTGAASIAKTIVPTVTKAQLKFQPCKIDERPPFITVVPKKKFLPSKFDMLFEKSLFTFSSLPKPVEVRNTFQKSGSHSSPGFRRLQLSPPRGVHDYYNVMWDPHVYRGNTASQFKTSKESLPGLVPKTPDSHDSSKGILRRKRSSTLQTQTQPASSYRSGTKFQKFHTPRVYSNTHTSMSMEDRLHRLVQTEIKFIEELSPDSGGLSDATVQTEPIYDLDPFSPITSPPPQLKSIQVKFGIDVGTQIMPGELYDFDQEIEPILQSLVEKIIEQAMYETVEEEEIAALKEQRYRFQEQRRLEELELQRLQEQQRKIRAEKEQLVRHLEKETTILPDYNEIRRKFGNQEDQNEESLTCSTSYLLEILPSVLNTLRQEGFVLNDKHLLVPGEETNEVSDSNKDDNDSQEQDHDGEEPIASVDEVREVITEEENVETTSAQKVEDVSKEQSLPNIETDQLTSIKEEFIDDSVNSQQSINYENANSTESILCCKSFPQEENESSESKVISSNGSLTIKCVTTENPPEEINLSDTNVSIDKIDTAEVLVAEQIIADKISTEILVVESTVDKTSITTEVSKVESTTENVATEDLEEKESDFALACKSTVLASDSSEVLPENIATPLDNGDNVTESVQISTAFQDVRENEVNLSTLDQNQVEKGELPPHIEPNILISHTDPEEQSVIEAEHVHKEEPVIAESSELPQPDKLDLAMQKSLYKSTLSKEISEDSMEKMEPIMSETSSQSERYELGTTEALIHTHESEIEKRSIDSGEIEKVSEETLELINETPSTELPETSSGVSQLDLNNSTEQPNLTCNSGNEK